ncbi:MAG: type IV pili methyl-accepting chemotaxis transducer N-terminal domain-containing protein [Campylobacterota bacterium]
MKSNTIKTKIRVIGLLFIILISTIILTTIFLNNNNKKDAMVINIAGKQRMLTQKISKNIFYIYHNQNHSFSQLDKATTEFIYNLNSLKDGNRLTGIYKAPNKQIAKQIAKIEILWNNFHENIKEFKSSLTNNENDIKITVNAIYETNNNLLEEVDKLVSMYTLYSENKAEYLKYVQYFFTFLVLLLMIYSFIQLKKVEDNANKFLNFSKKLRDENTNQTLEPLNFDAENEIVEATNSINCFINKVNSAVEYSTNASIKLQEITNEFDEILDELNNSKDISKTQLNKSEDMVIESQEEIINSTNKLQNLKKQLDLVLQDYNRK